MPFGNFVIWRNRRYVNKKTETCLQNETIKKGTYFGDETFLERRRYIVNTIDGIKYLEKEKV